MLKFITPALLLTALTACSGVTFQAGTPIATDFQGEWSYGTISSVQYYNPINGHWGQANGAGDRFKLEPNGNYERSRLLQITTGNCESNLFIYEIGTVRMENSQLSISAK